MGGCLAPHWKAWQAAGAEDWTVKVLRLGYRLPFSPQPPALSNAPLYLRAYHQGSERHSFLSKEVASLQEKGAVEIVKSPSPGYYSRLFLVPKASGGWRPIIDLSPLNKSLQLTDFKMETVASVITAIRAGDFMASIDLQDAYFQIPVHPASRKFLRFMFEGDIFQFKCLCFGLATAPQVFTRVFQLVSEWAHRRSIRLLRYLDDWLIIATSLAECQAHLRMVLDFVLSLGVKINSKKSDLTPKQVSCYLGMEINTVSSRVFPSEARILKLKSHISKFLRSTYNSAKDFQVLLGLLASMEKLVPGGRMRMRAMQWQLKELWHFPMDPDTLLPSNPQMSLDLQWWSQSTHLRLGTPLGCPPPQSLLFTDASTEGWGAHWNKSTASGLWSSSEKALHINVLEMRAVLLALKKFAPQLQGQKLGLMSDNSSVVAYLNKQGGTKSADLCKATREVLQLAEFHAISLRANYIPGKKNILADSLSRKFQIIQTEWSLNQGIANRVIRKWGSPNIDLFATSLNKKLPLYFSPLKDDEALGEDALQQDWSNRDVYAYPPQGIIQRVLAKVRESRNMHMTLIAPLHPRALWFPDLLDLLTERPITLPLVEDLITQPMTGTPHGNLISLSLHAWRLSSKSSERRVFRDRMPRTRPTQSESPPRRSTMGNGRSMWIGAIGEASIHSLLLDRRWSTSSDS